MASIPAGIIGLALEHQLRTLTAKPEVAAVFLMVNGLVLFAAERFRRRAQVRELAVREGAKPDGGRELETMEYREAFVIGAAQSTALVAGISRDGVTMGAGLARGLDHSDSARFAFLLATPIILAAGLVKLPDLLGHLGDGVRGQALVGVRGRGGDGVLHRALPRQLLQNQNADPVRHLLPGVRRVHARLHAGVGPPRRARSYLCCNSPYRAIQRLLPPSCERDAGSEDPPEDVRDPQPGLAGGRPAAPDQPEGGQARALEALLLLPLFVGVVVLYDNRVSLLGTAGPHGHPATCWNRRWKRPCASRRCSCW